jgi:hypothetical protein
MSTRVPGGERCEGAAHRCVEEELGARSADEIVKDLPVATLDSDATGTGHGNCAVERVDSVYVLRRGGGWGLWHT